MAKRLNITVDEEVFDYVERHGGANRSAFINDVLRQWQQQELEREIIRGLQEDAKDADYQEEVRDWDISIADGIEDEDETI